MRWEDFYVPSRFVRDYERHSFTEKEKDVVRYLNNQVSALRVFVVSMKYQ